MYPLATVYALLGFIEGSLENGVPLKTSIWIVRIHIPPQLSPPCGCSIPLPRSSNLTNQHYFSEMVVLPEIKLNDGNSIPAVCSPLNLLSLDLWPQIWQLRYGTGSIAFDSSAVEPELRGSKNQAKLYKQGTG